MKKARSAETIEKALKGDHPFVLNRRDKKAIAKHKAKLAKVAQRQERASNG